MRRRCLVMLPMCILSTHSWLFDTMFRKLDDDGCMTLAFSNCLLFLGYLAWDVHRMVRSVDHVALYRVDLMVHHIAAFASYLCMFQIVPMLGSRILAGEYLSVLNSTLSVEHLRYYRVFALCFIRLPMWVYFILYYNPFWLHRCVASENVGILRLFMQPSCVFGFGYDVVLLWRCVRSIRNEKSGNAFSIHCRETAVHGRIVGPAHSHTP
jgi:hypothetical protein